MPTLLIVEDDADSRDAVREVLVEDGWEVVPAASGAAALAALRDGCRPDVVLLDVVMPKMSGTELLTHLRATAEFADIPVILCSAAPTKTPGATAVLQKPLGIEELLGTVNRFRPVVRGAPPSAPL